MTMSRRNVLIDGATAAAMSVAGSESPEDAQSRTGRTRRSLDIIIIIVGGGSAAAVLAAGLNADVQRPVLLLEAGQNFKPKSYPSAITDANVVAAPAFNRHYQADDPVRRSPDIPVPRGRVIGGRSAVSAAVAMRARAGDFDRRDRRSVQGWSREQVLPLTGDGERAIRRGCIARSQRPFPDLPAHDGGEHPSMSAFVELRKPLAWRTYRISTALCDQASVPIRSTRSMECG
jgi:choline dehydrogenase